MQPPFRVLALGVSAGALVLLWPAGGAWLAMALTLAGVLAWCCWRGAGAAAEILFGAALASQAAAPALTGAPRALPLAAALSAIVISALPMVGRRRATFLAVGLMAALLGPALHAAQPALLPPLLACAVAMAAIATWLTQQQAMQQRERFDVEYLVRAMTHEHQVRLDLGVVRADSDIGQRLQQVQQRMVGLLRGARAAVDVVRNDSQALAAGGSDLRERTERSAEGLRDAAMTLEQISAIVTESAKAAARARELALAASEHAQEGASTFSKVAERMRDIDAAAQRITDIVSVIDDIAFQTDILALNAAVEAARAGENGRGFAVVAAEVRNLALRASQSAAQVKSLIHASAETTRDGSALVRAADERVGQMVVSMQKVGEVFAALSADTSQHAGSIEAVTQSVLGLKELTQMNVTLVETTQQVATRLSEHGSLLDQQLAMFQIGGADRAGGAAPQLPSDSAVADSAAPTAKSAPGAEPAGPAATESSPAPAAARTAAPATAVTATTAAAAVSSAAADPVEFF